MFWVLWTECQLRASVQWPPKWLMTSFPWYTVPPVKAVGPSGEGLEERVTISVLGSVPRGPRLSFIYWESVEGSRLCFYDSDLASVHLT